MGSLFAGSIQIAVSAMGTTKLFIIVDQIKSNLVASPGRASMSASCVSRINRYVDRVIEGV
jgi:hypothetical protein